MLVTLLVFIGARGEDRAGGQETQPETRDKEFKDILMKIMDDAKRERAVEAEKTLQDQARDEKRRKMNALADEMLAKLVPGFKKEKMKLRDAEFMSLVKNTVRKLMISKGIDEQVTFNANRVKSIRRKLLKQRARMNRINKRLLQMSRKDL